MGVSTLAGRAGADQRIGALLPVGWWARGLALHERVGHPRPPLPDAVDDAPRACLRQWRERHGGALDVRLAALGLDESGLLALLAEHPEHLAARTARPEWADAAERAVLAARPWPVDVTPPADWRTAFALVVAPFADDAAAHLAMPVADVHAVGVREAFARRLTGRLADLAARTIVHQLHTYRRNGRLTGADGTERFASFIRALTTPSGLAALLVDYPVLARLLGQAATSANRALAEVLARFAADRPALVAGVLDGVDPGPLTDVETDRGDSHDGGRSAAVLRFADGRRVLYKPREQRAQEHLGALVTWLNQAVPGLALRRLRTVARPGYGWSEYVAQEPLADAAAADAFHRRLGALLALFHAWHTTDLHCENVIASGDQPVVVDVETLLHHPSPAEVRGSGDPAADALAGSVHRTTLLPLMAVGEHGILDLSGCGGDGGRLAPVAALGWSEPGTDRMRPCPGPATYDGARNRARLGGVDIEPGDHEAALLEGFRLGYAAIAARPPELLALLEGCADLPNRLVVRPTWTYQALLDETAQPELLRDALDRDQAWAVLWTGPGYLRQFARYEVADLWRGDVPLFQGFAGDTRIWPAGGGADGPIAAIAGPTGLASALRKIIEFGESDRQDQEWIISATLATRRAPDGHRGPGPAGPDAGTAADPERLVAAACALADQVVARSLPDGERVNWLGLELVDERQWLVMPMGGGLANGYLGVALFLAQLAEISGIRRYAGVAGRALSPLAGLLDSLRGRPDLIRAIGPGGLHGFGGIAYALARLSRLLNDPDLRRCTALAVELSDVDGCEGLDWAGGGAGALAAMLAVEAEAGTAPERVHNTVVRARAAAVADRWAGTIVTRLDRTAELPAGFATGAAGIGWALAAYAATGRGDADRVTAASRACLVRAASRSAGDRAGPGWCQGDAGTALALSRLGDDSRLATMIGVLSDRPISRDLSPCHGEAGIADALLALAAPSAVRRRRAGLLLGALQWRGPGCGTPGAVVTPGLLTGLSGIGYALLRLAAPDRVPSAILLQSHRDIHIVRS
jgi:type 2 lantibiotic biosynthesis protein LanM